MLRVVRGLADNYVYYIINRGNGRQEVFHKEKDYEPITGQFGWSRARYGRKAKQDWLLKNT
jgi:putative transposase